MGEFLKKLKNLPGKQRAKLVYALISVVTSAAVLIAATTTMAWFSSNRDVDASRMQIATEYDDLTARCAVYLWDVDTEKGVSQNEDSTNILLNQGKPFLTYDTIFVERNRYNPVIVEITVTGERYQNKGGTLTVTVERAPDQVTPAYVDDAGSPVAEQHSNDTDSFFFTSVMNFACGKVAFTQQASYGEASDAFKSADDQIYQEAKAAFVTENSSKILEFNNGVTPVNFIDDSDPEDLKKKDSVSFAITYHAGDWQSNELKVYLFINYDDELSADIVGASTGTFTGDVVHTATNLENDLSRIFIGAVAAA